MPNANSNQNAEELFDRWSQATFEQVHHAVISFLPPPPANALDIGSGSGRDAIALASRGYQVTAVEPWHQMRLLSEGRCRNFNINLIDDSLPELTSICTRSEKYSLILISAVWMHLNRQNRLRSLQVLRNILIPTIGRMIVTLRNPPDMQRDMFDVKTDELVRDGASLGMTCVETFEGQKDALGRPTVTWSCVVLET